MSQDPLAAVYATRLSNLRALAKDSQKLLAKQLGVSPANLNQLVKPVPTRRITEGIARRFEEKLGLQHGWLDMTRGV
jgi:transcriptional regulator with XRE-family HTH domain